jgi:hypothetical protein
MGMPAGYAALSVGAASALTNGGDLKQGLMNGISAYGGADMATTFMGAGLGAMGTSAAAPATVLETAPGAASPYALTGSTAAPSTAGYSLGESSSFLNKPLPTLASAAPAEVAKQAATLTPAAQAAQQSAALNELTMGQRWDALKAGATGTNAMNYIKANPLTSLGVATAAMTPDEVSTPQKAANTDRGARAGMRYYPGYGTSLPKPNMQGIEQTYNRPYYAAEGGVAHMAEGGITLPLDQKQLFADYLARVSGGAGAGVEVAPTPKDEVKAEAETPKIDLPFLEAPVSSNTRGSGRPVREGPDAPFNPSPEFAKMMLDAGKNLSSVHPLMPFGMAAQLLGAGATKYGSYLSSVAERNAAAKNIADYGAAPGTLSAQSNRVLNQLRSNEGYGDGPGNDGLGGITGLTGVPGMPSGVVQALGEAAAGRSAMGTGAPGIQGDPNQGNEGMHSVQAPTPSAPDSWGGENRGGRSSDGGGYGGGVATGGNNGDASGGGDRGTRGGWADGGGIYGGTSDPYDLGSYSDGGRLLKGPGDGVSDSIPATIGKGRPARLADGEFVIPARIVSEIGNGSTEAGARKLYAMMDRVQAGRKKSVGKGKVAVNSRADRHLPA